MSIRERLDFTPKQKEFIRLALDKQTKVLITDGLWGTSKTFLTIYCALKLLNDRRISEIIYIRNPIESSSVSKLGYLKGDIDEKMAPYSSPLFDKLEELLPVGEMNALINENRIKIMAPGFIRGHSWNCKVIIVDESSCLTIEDLFLIISRVGEFSKIYFIGDSFQNDIGSKSGFLKFFHTFNDQESKDNGIFTFEFKDNADIVRSSLLRFLMKKLKLTG
ncbi:MAG: PhoH family protein [Nanoarchaeota archaeon]